MPEKILVIDDESEVVDVISKVLKTEGYEVKGAIGGREGLDILGRELFDLILLDVMMPDLDGFTVCMNIKSRPQTKDIPVVFLTGKGGAEAFCRGLEAGASMYLAKPFSSSKLLAIVESTLPSASASNPA